MNTKIFGLSVVAVIVSFIGGFVLANALNKTELNNLRADNERLKNAAAETNQTGGGLTLSETEIREKIAEADRNPTNFTFQKNLGIALYRYAAMKQNVELFVEVKRILSRANELNRQDYDVTVVLGNTLFDIGYYNKDNRSFEQARQIYAEALRQKPNDVDVRTDLGLTYFLVNPPENERAIAEFQKSLQTNPKHEKTLQVIAQTHLSRNNAAEAEKYLARLKEVNAANQYLAELEARLAQIKGNQPN